MCIEKGLSVLQGDINKEILDYSDKSFDYCILSQTLQQVYDPEGLIKEILRVGKRAIVSFPNFGHIKIRLQLLGGGKAPVSRELPYQWYDSPNIRVLTLEDFKIFANKIGFNIHKKAAIKPGEKSHGFKDDAHAGGLAQAGKFFVACILWLILFYLKKHGLNSQA